MDYAALALRSRAAAKLRTRRAITTGLAALAAHCASALLPGDDATAAKRQRRRRHAQPRHRAQPEKKKARKATWCVDGQTTQVSLSKKSKKRLRKQGAIPGACAATADPPQPAPTCSPTCVAGLRCCGSECVTGAWANQTTVDGFAHPYGVALSPDARTAWVADTFNYRVAVWTRPSATSTAWQSQTAFGAYGTGATQLQFPAGIAVTPDGRTALIADYLNHRISIWTRPGAATSWTHQTNLGGPTAGADTTQFNGPMDVAITPDGRTAVVAELFNHRVSVWTRPDLVSDWANDHVFGGPGNGNAQFAYPTGVAISDDGLLVAVADQNNHRLAIWTRTSTGSSFLPQTIFGSGVAGAAPGQFNLPYRVALSIDQRIAFVGDSGNNRVSVWTRSSATSVDWTNQTTVGSTDPGPAHLADPRGVALSPDGQTFLAAEYGNNRIAVWGMTCPA